MSAAAAVAPIAGSLAPAASPSTTPTSSSSLQQLHPSLSSAHPSHPLLQEDQQRTAIVEIQGHQIRLIVTSFVDRIFVAVMQGRDKMGSIIHATTNQPLDTSSSSTPTYTTTTLLGVRSSPLSSLLARRLIESLSMSHEEHMARKPLLLSVTLESEVGRMKRRQQIGGGGGGGGDDFDAVASVSDEELELVREIVKQVDKIKMW